MHAFKSLKIWQKSVALATKTYQITATWPTSEQFGLTSQIRRSAVSIGSNIAEGAGRGSTKEFANFLNIALGSSCELETQLIIGKEIGFLNKEKCEEMCVEVEELQKMMFVLRKKLIDKQY